MQWSASTGRCGVRPPSPLIKKIGMYKLWGTGRCFLLVAERT